MDYEASRKFFVKEMKLRMFASSLKESGLVGDYVFLTFYKWLANYGESYLKPLLVILLAIIFFSLIDAALTG